MPLFYLLPMKLYDSSLPPFYLRQFIYDSFYLGQFLSTTVFIYDSFFPHIFPFWEEKCSDRSSFYCRELYQS